MGMGRTYTELLADEDDFNIANGFAGLILAPHHGEFDARLYRPVERPIVLSWQAKGVIGNGGFQFLFEGEWPGDSNYGLTIDAHRAIGCDDQVKAFQLALEATDGSTEQDERWERFAELPDEDRERINALYWGKGDAVQRQIAIYVRSNARRLKHLRGRIS